jgi:hypothetical protein
VDGAAAQQHVATSLPGLDEQAARALAIVALAGRSRADAGQELDLDPERLADVLARGRKSLRRSLFPLAGSGWCERAERLISDRLDGALEEPGSTQLDVHLRNCPRCLEHERRLVQATDHLTETFEQAHGAPAPPAESPAAAPALAVVRPPSGPRSLPFGQPVRPAARTPVLEQGPPAEEAILTGSPEPQPATEAPTMPAVPRKVTLPPAATITWGALLVLAVLLVVASVALAIAGILGASIL